MQYGVTVVSVARKHGGLRCQIFEWRQTYKEGRLANVPALLPVRPREVSKPERQPSVAGVISIEVANARIDLDIGLTYHQLLGRWDFHPGPFIRLSTISGFEHCTKKALVSTKDLIHSGRIIRRECLDPLDLNIEGPARLLGITRQALNNVGN